MVEKRREGDMSGGFIGKYAVVDLDAKSTETIQLDEDFYKKFLFIGCFFLTFLP